MSGTRLRKTRSTVVGALGAAILLGTPLLAHADQGKWWTPKEGGRGSQGQVRERAWGNRGHDGAWRGARIHRDMIVIRDGYRIAAYDWDDDYDAGWHGQYADEDWDE